MYLSLSFSKPSNKIEGRLTEIKEGRKERKQVCLSFLSLFIHSSVIFSHTFPEDLVISFFFCFSFLFALLSLSFSLSSFSYLLFRINACALLFCCPSLLCRVRSCAIPSPLPWRKHLLRSLF